MLKQLDSNSDNDFHLFIERCEDYVEKIELGVLAPTGFIPIRNGLLDFSFCVKKFEQLSLEL